MSLPNSSELAHQRPGTFALLIVPIFMLVSINPIPVFAQSAPSVSIQFTNATASAGIKFTHFKGNNGISINREEFGPGLCVADFDGDGWQDIYFVNGRDLYNRGIAVINALYHNNGNGTFTDVTDKAGVPGTDYGLGCMMSKHSDYGYQIVKKVPSLLEVAEIVYTHQECFDGTGYPRGLKGDEIPLGARIVAVAASLDAITSDRPGRHWLVVLGLVGLPIGKWFLLAALALGVLVASCLRFIRKG